MSNLPPLNIDLEIYTGNDWTIDVTHSLTPANIETVYFYVKKRPHEELVMGRDSSSSPVFTVASPITITLTGPDTDGLAHGLWYYDVKVRMTNNAIHTLQRGRINFIANISSDAAVP